MTFPARELSFLIGFLSLGAETLWIRTFSFASESTPKSLALVLGLFLLGIAYGARVGGQYCREGADLPRVLANCLLAAAGVILLSPFAMIMTNGWIVVLVLGILSIATLFSICFPICHHLGTQSAGDRVGRSMSQVYASNIAGSTCGPLVVNFVILNWVTTQTAFAILGVATALVAAWLVARRADVIVPQRGMAMAMAGAAVAVVGWSSFADNHLVRALSIVSSDPIRQAVETRQGIVVSYAQQKSDMIYGGNVYDGRTNLDPRINSNGIHRIIMLAALTPKPKRVLVLGLSIGSWQYIANGFPGVEKIDIIEINPGYLQLIKNYPEQHRAVNDPRITLHIGDGRKFLRQNPDALYDLVIMNTTWHWRAYSSMLLSRDFLSVIKSHMAPDAVVTYNSTSSPDVLKTAAQVFPHAYLYDNFVIGARFDWREKMREPEAAARLRAIRPEGKPLFGPGDDDLVANFLSVDKWVKDLATVERATPRPLEVITDRNLITEYRYGR